MAPKKQQYHHYIPRFILRNYSVDECAKPTTNNFLCDGLGGSVTLSSMPSKKAPKNNNPNINIMRSDGILEKEKISCSYGLSNLYKDCLAEDVMEVEKLLAKLESNVSLIIKRIIINEATQRDTTLLRQELALIKTFLFVMSYRSERRRNQYMHGRFDFITGMMMQRFMEIHKVDSPQTVWLNNIRIILEASDLVQVLKSDPKTLYPAIRNDIEATLSLYFLCLWKAPPATEFLISNTAFGLWEGNGPALIYHQFYPVSPSIMLVQSSVRFKTDSQGRIMSSLVNNLSGRQSWFETLPHPTPKRVYKKSPLKNSLLMDGVDRTDPLDEFTYSFVEIPKDAINRINAIIIDESVQISFTSELYIYRALKYYNRVKHEMPNKKDVKPMIQTLLGKLRRRHMACSSG